MGLLLDMSPRALEEVIYFAYVVVDPGPTGLEKKTLLSEAEFRDYYDKYPGQFVAKMGAEGIKDLLEEIDLDKDLTNCYAMSWNQLLGQRLTRAIKHLEVVESLRNSGNKPSWMILDVLPIIPPGIKYNGSIRWWTICNK